MKRGVSIVALVALFAVSFWWFSRQHPGPPLTPLPLAPQVDPKQAEREALFGMEALAAGVEWRESGLGYHLVDPGAGPKPGIGARVRLTYIGRLKDGTVFDHPETPSEFLIGATIPGLSVGLQMLGTGGRAVFFIPPSLGYGHRKVVGIPPDSGLIFEVQVVGIEP